MTISNKITQFLRSILMVLTKLQASGEMFKKAIGGHGLAQRLPGLV